MHDDVGGGTERHEYELMADEREEEAGCLPVGDAGWRWRR